jgi:hypothetical protein
VRATLGVKAPSYDKVMQLDEKIRNFGQPQANPADARTAVSMKKWAIFLPLITPLLTFLQFRPITL